jgi:hypothetical protein
MSIKNTNLNEITAVHGSNKLLSIENRLQANDFSKIMRDTLHSEYSRIKLIGIDYKQKTADGKAVFAECNIEPEIFKVIAQKILSGDNYLLSKVNKNKTKGFTQEKITQKTMPDGKFFVSKFAISYEEALTEYPIKIRIENGRAEKNVDASGKTTIKSGTYIKEKDFTIFLSEWDACKAMRETLDAIDRFERGCMGPYLKKLQEEKTKAAAEYQQQ